VASTLVQFLPTPLKRTLMSQYSQGSVSAFATQFNIDWAPFLPSGSALAISAKTGAATVAEVVISTSLPPLEVNPTDWVTCTNGIWAVYPASVMGRTVSDGATNTNTTVTSATAAFANPADVGAVIAGPGIPPGTTITIVGSSTSVTISAAATATATGQPLTITRTTSLFTPAVI